MTDELIHLDAAALRVLAHPLRSRLLSELRLHGPATATDLADRLGDQHRRHQLPPAQAGVGRPGHRHRRPEPASAGSGRPSSRGHEWTPSDFAGDDDAEASLTWLTRHYQSTAGRAGRALGRGPARVAAPTGATRSATATTASP